MKLTYQCKLSDSRSQTVYVHYQLRVTLVHMYGNRPSLTQLFTVMCILCVLGLALLTVLYECARGTGVMTGDGNIWHVGDTTHYPQFKWCDTLVCARRATCVVAVGFVRMPPSCCNKVFTSFRKGLLALKAICCFLCQVQPSHQWTIASQMHLNISILSSEPGAHQACKATSQQGFCHLASRSQAVRLVRVVE